MFSSAAVWKNICACTKKCIWIFILIFVYISYILRVVIFAYIIKRASLFVVVLRRDTQLQGIRVRSRTACIYTIYIWQIWSNFSSPLYTAYITRIYLSVLKVFCLYSLVIYIFCICSFSEWTNKGTCICVTYKRTIYTAEILHIKI